MENVIRWDRQADGSYKREGELSPDVEVSRIFVIDEDFETNKFGTVPGSKVWTPKDAIELVERKIKELAYTAWRYEVRADTTKPEHVSRPAEPVTINSYLASSYKVAGHHIYDEPAKYESVRSKSSTQDEIKATFERISDAVKTELEKL